MFKALSIWCRIHIHENTHFIHKYKRTLYAQIKSHIVYRNILLYLYNKHLHIYTSYKSTSGARNSFFLLMKYKLSFLKFNFSYKESDFWTFEV